MHTGPHFLNFNSKVKKEGLIPKFLLCFLIHSWDAETHVMEFHSSSMLQWLNSSWV